MSMLEKIVHNLECAISIAISNGNPEWKKEYLKSAVDLILSERAERGADQTTIDDLHAKYMEKQPTPEPGLPLSEKQINAIQLGFQAYGGAHGLLDNDVMKLFTQSRAALALQRENKLIRQVSSATLEKALEFYADPAKYVHADFINDKLQTMMERPVLVDGGQTAKTALGAVK